MDEAAALMFPRHAVVYVATSDAGHEETQAIVHALRQGGFRPVLLGELLSRNATLAAMLARIGPTLTSNVTPARRGSTQLSCSTSAMIMITQVEQIVCAYGDYYVGTFPSSWDELVFQIRHWLGLFHSVIVFVVEHVVVEHVVAIVVVVVVVVVVEYVVVEHVNVVVHWLTLLKIALVVEAAVFFICSIISFM